MPPLTLYLDWHVLSPARYRTTRDRYLSSPFPRPRGASSMRCRRHPYRPDTSLVRCCQMSCLAACARLFPSVFRLKAPHASGCSPCAGQHRMHLEVAMVSHRSEEHTSELQSLMRISYAVFCLKKKNHTLRVSSY